jgi:hypothetical protein
VLTHHLITQGQYGVLITVVILSAFVPTLIAQQWFEPDLEGLDEELEEEAGEEDLTALHHTHRQLPASRSEQPTDRVADRGGAKAGRTAGLGSRSALSSSRLYFGARSHGLAHQTSTDRIPIPAPVTIKASSVSPDR